MRPELLNTGKGTKTWTANEVLNNGYTESRQSTLVLNRAHIFSFFLPNAWKWMCLSLFSYDSPSHSKCTVVYLVTYPKLNWYVCNHLIFFFFCEIGIVGELLSTRTIHYLCVSTVFSRCTLFCKHTFAHIFLDNDAPTQTIPAETRQMFFSCKFCL